MSLVLKKIHGGSESKVPAKPTCSKAAAPNVATNSRALPGPKEASVAARAPSTVSWPPETATDPPPPHAAPVQPAGSAEPENSSFTAGARMTSPSAICETRVFASSVPAEKSATVVSVAEPVIAPVVNVHVSSDPSALPEASVTVPATVTW